MYTPAPTNVPIEKTSTPSLSSHYSPLSLLITISIYPFLFHPSACSSAHLHVRKSLLPVSAGKLFCHPIPCFHYLV